MGLLNVLTDIIWRITISWRAGNLACKVIRFMQACVTYASTYVLVALSIDRYDAITRPMNFSGSCMYSSHSCIVFKCFFFIIIVVVVVVHLPPTFNYSKHVSDLIYN